MKISINSQFLSGPYGGGMQFANFMRSFLTIKGFTVVNNLHDPDIDIILNVSPFPFLTPDASAYSFLDAYAYKMGHPNTIIIERVNECDERKGTHYMNQLLIRAAKRSDFVVYIASWLQKLLESQGLPQKIPSRTILNGADSAIFNATDVQGWDGTEKMKIVTHHWSNNPNKGHDIYQHLDQLLDNPDFSEKFEFTYIGRIPAGFHYRNTTVIPPLAGKALAQELKRHHVYITASRDEPGGMHHIEAALCGLPILYIDSGALPEYCEGFGIEFSPENLPHKLTEMRRDYSYYRDTLRTYPNTAEHMGSAYLALIRELYESKKTLRTPRSGKQKAVLLKAYSRIFSAWWSIRKRLFT